MEVVHHTSIRQYRLVLVLAAHVPRGDDIGLSIGCSLPVHFLTHFLRVCSPVAAVNNLQELNV